MYWLKKTGFITLLLTLAALLFACGGTSGTTTTTGHLSGTTPTSGTTSAAPEQLVINGHYSDERFIDMMVPHHLMAIQMAQLAVQKTQHPEIKQLATSIIHSQAQEVQALKALKKRLYGTSQTPTMMNEADMQNTGMLMPDQLAQQRPFDRAFIDSMIPHHASAIDMASVALMRSTNADIKRMARGIVDAQSQEIGEMIQWRKLWYPGSITLGGSLMVALSTVDRHALSRA